MLVSSKGVPTLLLFFDMTKYFCKKIQKKCILHDLFGISGLMGLHN